MIIDSHCHLDRFYKKGQLDEILQRAVNSDVQKIVAIGTNSDDWKIYQKLTNDYAGKIFYSVGLHPTDIDDNWENVLSEIASYFENNPRPVAVGEIGLDHFHLPKDLDSAKVIKATQVEVFKKQLKIAKKYNCPIVIHSRNSFSECVELIDQNGVDWSKVVFHCFSDGPDEIELLNKRGGRGSFTGIITFKNAQSIRDAAIAQGLDKILIETDAPYLAPEPFRGKPNEPAYLHHTAEYCAKLFNLNINEFTKQATQNTISFFNLNV